MKKDITELFVFIDNFCLDYDQFIQHHTLPSQRKPTRRPGLQMYHSDFPGLPGYNRFLELQQRCLGHFHALMVILCTLPKKTGIAYVDSTCIPVCHNKRTSRHKVFKGLAALGKSAMGWFFGFKLHLIINEKGELLSACLTPGNVDDRKPIRSMTKHLTGLLFADKGYIDQTLFQDLFHRGLKIITGIKANMKNKFMGLQEKIFLRKRSISETVNSVLKKDFQISHTRHRSFLNGFIHIFSTLIAYVLKNNKPAIKMTNLIQS